MKKIKLKGAVFFTLRDGVNQTSTMYLPNREYVVDDAVAMHPVFADRLILCEDVKVEPEPNPDPVKTPAKRTRRRTNVRTSNR